jgi:hypothetical protein
MAGHSMPTFAELFCERYHVAPADYARAMFWRCLHRRGLPLAPFIFLVNRQYFAPDFELIMSVGRLTSATHLNTELDDFRSHPGNHGWTRRLLRVRVSGARLCRVMRSVLPHAKASLLIAPGGVAPDIGKVR